MDLVTISNRGTRSLYLLARMFCIKGQKFKRAVMNVVDSTVGLRYKIFVDLFWTDIQWFNVKTPRMWKAISAFFIWKIRNRREILTNRLTSREDERNDTVESQKEQSRYTAEVLILPNCLVLNFSTHACVKTTDTIMFRDIRKFHGTALKVLSKKLERSIWV